MGVVKPKYTLPMSENATVKGAKVSWTDKRGKRKTGTLTATGRVQVETETWQIRYRDEHGVERRESTRFTKKDDAQQLLIRRKNEVERIALGIASREEVERIEKNKESLEKQLELFGNKQYAAGSGDDHIQDTRRKIEALLEEAKIGKIQEITAERVETWIAEQRRAAVRAPRTINSYLVALKSFCAWLYDTGRTPAHAIKRVKKLNEELDRRKRRRSLTDDELRRLFETARVRKHRAIRKRRQIELVYRLLAGTGLRSKELSLATPEQFDFRNHRFTVRATSTKNKRSDVLPLRLDLSKAVRMWIEENAIKPGNRIFD